MCLALAQKIWHIFNGCNPYTQLCSCILYCLYKIYRQETLLQHCYINQTQHFLTFLLSLYPSSSSPRRFGFYLVSDPYCVLLNCCLALIGWYLCYIQFMITAYWLCSRAEEDLTWMGRATREANKLASSKFILIKLSQSFSLFHELHYCHH